MFFYRFDPSEFDSLPSPFTSTLTLTLPPDDNSLKFQVGLTVVGVYQQILKGVSPIFEKPSKNKVYSHFKVSFIHLFYIFNFFIFLSYLSFVFHFNHLKA